ncbi:MAG: hypothetical protein V1721_10310 [Pseudomonadota bacterium]
MRFFLILVAALLLGVHPAAADSLKSPSRPAAIGTSPSVQNAVPGVVKGQDVESAAGQAMMQSAQDSSQDLKATLGDMQKTNQQKSQMRGFAGKKGGRSNEAALRGIESEINDLQQKLDSLSDLSEEESIKIQGLQDRMSRMMSTLSNILKKYSDAQSGIIQNMK